MFPEYAQDKRIDISNLLSTNFQENTPKLIGYALFEGVKF
jgi:hypothetical protein